MPSGAYSPGRNVDTPNGDPAGSGGDRGVSPTKGAPRGGAAGEPAPLGASQVLWTTLVLLPLSEQVELPRRGSVEGAGLRGGSQGGGGAPAVSILHWNSLSSV